MSYVKAAVQEEPEFECSEPLDADLSEAINWMEGKTEQEVMDERESVMRVRAFNLAIKSVFVFCFDLCAGDRDIG